MCVWQRLLSYSLIFQLYSGITCSAFPRLGKLGDTIPYAPAIYLDLYMRLEVKECEVRFSYSLDNRHFLAAGLPFTMRQGKWIGAKYGFIAACDSLITSRGWMDVDWVRVTK